ncbi:hypothetical protein F4861DRAFT_530769 [Xylaria intraflava]|nr:hypothetical protein F4861DRAFT_530769 [Xylaria intraflava]
MSDQLFSTSVGPHGTIRARPPPLRTKSPSPSRQRHTSDELLSQLTPASVVEALQSPTGPLRECLDRASPLEQSFALKTAVASKTVHDWFEELSGWSWPSAGTATGFEMPPAKKRKVSEPETPGDDRDTTTYSDSLYFGSLPADHVVRYEKRIEQIQQDMEDLNLDEIKNQVLHNHILPLSRPGTPFSDCGRSSASVFTFAKMEDLTAVVTAITVQTLPTLSKLSRLLRTWSLRLVVLRKVPPFLTRLTDIEAALRSGWSAIESMPSNQSDLIEKSKTGSFSTRPTSQKDIDVIKNNLQQKVARAGQDLDFMLDALEGMMDTLPDEWLDRMESVERDYAKWATAAERKAREAEWSKLPMLDRLDKPAGPKSSRPDIPVQDASVQSGSPQLPDPYEPFSSDAISPPSSPPLRYKLRSTASVTFKEIPQIVPLPEVNNSPPRGQLGPPVVFDADSSFDWDSQLGSPMTSSAIGDDDHLQKQLRELLETIPAKIELKKRGINLNPPDIQLPSRPKSRFSDASRRPNSALSSRPDSRVTTPSYSRSGTPSFMLAPVRDTRPRSTSSQGIRLYHLSRSGEMPIKLFIRCVGEQNERVMVRVGGGWSDLGEYLRDYALHHGSRSKGEGRVEVTDAVPVANKRPGSSHSSRPSSAHSSPMTPLSVRKTRQNPGEEVVMKVPRTPLGKSSTGQQNGNTPGSDTSIMSGASPQVDWDEEDTSLGLAGPKAAKRRDISAESRAWIESVKTKVRLASSERITTSISSEQLRPAPPSLARGHKKTPESGFGEMGKAGTTKRLFRKN